MAKPGLSPQGRRKRSPKVVSIHPDIPTPAIGKKSEAVIALLSDLLSEAKRGEILGITVGIVQPNLAIRQARASGEVSMRDLMVSALWSYESIKEDWKVNDE